LGNKTFNEKWVTLMFVIKKSNEYHH
jgi:hypothetical protein